MNGADEQNIAATGKKKPLVDSLVKPCWSFLWKRLSEPDDAWKCRKYRCKKLGTACKRMASFLAGRYVDWDDEIRVDYEACAEHVDHDPANHTATFPDLRSFENPLQGYLM